MTRPPRKDACYVACTRLQKAAIQRLAMRNGQTISAFISAELGRKFWIEVDREVLRTNTDAASRSESGNDG